jgi:hypothetical protein
MLKHVLKEEMFATLVFLTIDDSEIEARQIQRSSVADKVA